MKAAALACFSAIVKSILGKTKVVIYQELVEAMLKSFRVLGTKMYIKIYFLFRQIP